MIPAARFSRVVWNRAGAGVGEQWNGFDLDKADLALMDMGCGLDWQPRNRVYSFCDEGSWM